jgi:hypothetical protein
MIKYDPQNELTEAEVEKLSFEDCLDYLDQKAAYLKNFTRPLGTYQTKHFAAFTKGEALTTEELKKVKEIGKMGDEERAKNIAKAASKFGDDPKYRDPGIKNIKTHRSQWFD